MQAASPDSREEPESSRPGVRLVSGKLLQQRSVLKHGPDDEHRAKERHRQQGPQGIQHDRDRQVGNERSAIGRVPNPSVRPRIHNVMSPFVLDPDHGREEPIHAHRPHPQPESQHHQEKRQDLKAHGYRRRPRIAMIQPGNDER